MTTCPACLEISSPACPPFPAATKGKTMQTFLSIMNSIPWFAWIPIVAIICGTIGGIVRSVQVHDERMAMIRMGIHPDVKDVKAQKPYYEEQEV
jgi:hypothetical protein